ncbi:hypothetical protein L6452_17377 [Arctium lappa]|uniref:Uncharacterized protein n=1 Tax=Arctium lappa TaxID=4217 RepID=A0ACB9C3E1_ARCLA|nr:hypothetical protein L6452_17377 [Arctium lappa]
MRIQAAFKRARWVKSRFSLNLARHGVPLSPLGKLVHHLARNRHRDPWNGNHAENGKDDHVQYVHNSTWPVLCKHGDNIKWTVLGRNDRRGLSRRFLEATLFEENFCRKDALVRLRRSILSTLGIDQLKSGDFGSLVMLCDIGFRTVMIRRNWFGDLLRSQTNLEVVMVILRLGDDRNLVGKDYFVPKGFEKVVMEEIEFWDSKGFGRQCPRQ